MTMNHISVLKNEVTKCFDYLDQIGHKCYFVDGTLGLAGHSLAILEKRSAKNLLTIIGIDQDKTALKSAEEIIKKTNKYDDFILLHDNFKNIKNIATGLRIEKIDGAIIDLGVSSMQFDDKSRGFSFTDPGQTLDMRMDKDQKFDAKSVLNNYSEKELFEILKNYGEEKFAHKITLNTCRSRKENQITTVGDLLKILEISIPKKIQKTSKNHFATKTFQAIRIAVNDELNILEKTITDLADLLNTGGKLAIISFHSLEDRIVKSTFKNLANPCHCPANMPCICGLKPTVKILTTKPIIATPSEIESNPRARSAKLRIIEKL